MKKTVTRKELEKWYEEELKRKDKIIDKLKEENIVLMKTALKQSQKLVEMQKNRGK